MSTTTKDQIAAQLLLSDIEIIRLKERLAHAEAARDHAVEVARSVKEKAAAKTRRAGEQAARHAKRVAELESRESGLISGLDQILLLLEPGMSLGSDDLVTEVVRRTCRERLARVGYVPCVEKLKEPKKSGDALLMPEKAMGD